MDVSFTLTPKTQLQIGNIGFPVHDYIVKKRLLSIIGPWDEFVGMATEKVGIPYMATSLWGTGGAPNVFHMLPRPDDICFALLDIMAAYEWSLVSVIYDHTVGT